MKKTELILGIVSVPLFVISALFEMMHWPGSNILMGVSVLTFNFGYLPLQLIRERRLVSSLLERAYLIFRFVTLFIILFSFMFKIQHWSGGGILLIIASYLIPLYIIFYFYLRIRGKGKIPFQWSDLFIAAIAYFIYLFVTRSMVNPNVVKGYVILEEQYLKINAGLETANQLIYSSLDSAALDGDKDLMESIRELREMSSDIHRKNELLKSGFITSFYVFT